MQSQFPELSKYFSTKICDTHKLQCTVVKLVQNSNLQQKFGCNICLKENQFQFVELKDLEQMFLKLHQISNSIIEKKQLEQKNFCEYSLKLVSEQKKIINLMENEIKQCLNKLLSQNIDYINNLTDESINHGIESTYNQQQFIQNLITEQEMQLNYFKSVVKNILCQREDLQQQFQQLNYYLIQFNQNQIQDNKTENQQNLIIQKIQPLSTIFQEYQYKNIAKLENGDCFSLAFNQKSDILVCGGNKDIRLYKFNGQSLILLYELQNAHEKTVLCLQFSQYSNNFISGSKDQLVKIWTQNDQEQWICTQILQGHQGWINNILFDDLQNEIITSSTDKTIIIWRKFQQQWIIFQHLKDHEQPIWQLSYQLSQKLFVSRDTNNLILWNKSQSQQKYINYFKCGNLKDGFNVCFINDKIIATQNCLDHEITLYKCENNVINQIMQLNNNIQFDNKDILCMDIMIYPLQYCQSRNLLFLKKYKSLLVLKFNEDNYQLNLFQEIKLKNDWFVGTVENQGKHIILHDKNSIIITELQVNKKESQNGN